MKKLQSPLPWVGSKRQLRDAIIPKIPPHTCYVEAFAGGAWVYLGKPPSPIEVLNDVDGDLIALYKIIRDRHEEFQDALWFMFPSRDLYTNSKDILRDDKQLRILTEMERAVLFFYHIKNAFGARFGSGFAFSKTRPPRHVIGHDLLVALRDRLQNTYIENLSFERIIKNYDGSDTFFYLDPPYLMDTKDKCYRHGFSDADHTKLAATVRSIKGRFLLSYSDKKEIRELYHGFNIEQTEPVNYTLSGKSTYRRELLISNY